MTRQAWRSDQASASAGMTRPNNEEEKSHDIQNPSQPTASPAEHADILLRAAKASLSPSEFLRRSALSAEVVVQAEGPRDFETVDQLRRIGVNLNQLARVANKTGYLPDGLEEALAKVDQLLDRMIEL